MGTVTYVAIILPVFIGISALAIDYGLINYEKTNLQMAADASALAAAEYISPEENDFNIINGEATSIATYHNGYGHIINQSQVLTQVGDFTQNGDFIENTATGDYVLVSITNSNLPSIFGSLFGYESYNIVATSIAGKVSTTVNECVPVMENDWPCLMFAANSLELTGNFNISLDEPLSNSSVCTNASSITLGGNLSVQDGIDMHMGPNCPYSNGVSCITSHGGSYNFNGSSAPMGMEVVLPSVEYPDNYFSLPNGVRVGRGNNTVTTVQPGSSYFVDGNFTMNSNQAVSVYNSSGGCSEPAVIYVNGDVSLSGGVTGNADHPECLEIRVIGERTVRINGRTTFYGNIYAPESEVYPNGGADFYGTIMAGTIRANGNNNIILDSSYSSSVPNVSDQMDCEEREIQVFRVRTVK